MSYKQHVTRMVASILVLANQSRDLLKAIRMAAFQLKNLPDTDRELLSEITDAACHVEDAIDRLSDKVSELE
jgi:hypothetical protein